MDRQWVVNFLALLLSAALICYTVGNSALWPLGWVALWPVFYLLKQQPRWWERLLMGLIWLFCVSQLGFPYAVSTAYHHLHGHLFQAWLMGTTLGIVTSTRYLVFFLLAVPGRRQGLYLASLWCACELGLWQMMPVYGAVHVLGDRPLLQWSEWVGAPGVSWLWFFLSYQLYHRPRKALPLILLVHIIGLFQLENWQDRALSGARHRIAVIQANQPSALVQTVEVGLKARQIMLELTGAFLSDSAALPEVVVWPEASLPLVEYTRLGGFPALGVELIFTDFEPGTQAGYVLARLLDRSGQSKAVYRKRKLIMMGEWTPGDPKHSFQVGERDELLPSAAGPALPLVCFEGLWPSFVADFHRHTGGRATWLVHLGSESSFGSDLACYQSLNLLSIRAIELRRPLVRADNSGVSGWIDSAGTVHEATRPFTQASLMLEVPIASQPQLTLYARWADRPLWLLIGLSVLLQIAGARTLHQHKVDAKADGKADHPGE
ncbi:MAG: nitrilase-related carbon-nitrogen hydrolase [Vulcanimicrobiota bacterium]